MCGLFCKWPVSCVISSDRKLIKCYLSTGYHACLGLSSETPFVNVGGS